MLTSKLVVVLVALAGLCAMPGARAQAPAQDDRPPVEFTTNIHAAQLPALPADYVWQRIEEMQAAIATPAGWKRHARRGPFVRIVGYSPDPLDAEGRFTVGVTARLQWHPEVRPGLEAAAAQALLGGIVGSIRNNTAENRLLTSQIEERGARSVLTLRHRSAPEGATPHIVHTVAIADTLTGLVYEFFFEAPETEFDERWKTGEQILRRSVVLFQRG